MTNIEQFKSEASACEELEEKLDKLTDQLVTAFDTKEDLVWENGKPDKFREYIWCNNWWYFDIRVSNEGSQRFHNHGEGPY